MRQWVNFYSGLNSDYSFKTYSHINVKASSLPHYLPIAGMWRIGLVPLAKLDMYVFNQPLHYNFKVA